MKNDEDTFETIHQDDDGNEYFVLQDFQGKTIRIGDSKDIVENWDKLFSKWYMGKLLMDGNKIYDDLVPMPI